MFNVCFDNTQDLVENAYKNYKEIIKIYELDSSISFAMVMNVFTHTYQIF